MSQFQVPFLVDWLMGQMSCFSESLAGKLRPHYMQVAFSFYYSGTFCKIKQLENIELYSVKFTAHHTPTLMSGSLSSSFWLEWRREGRQFSDKLQPSSYTTVKLSSLWSQIRFQMFASALALFIDLGRTQMWQHSWKVLSFLFPCWLVQAVWDSRIPP